MLNPYAQSGWNTSQSPGDGSDPRQTRIFGALPFSPPDSQPNIVSFVFTYDHDIMNSMVLGPNGQHYYTIATNLARPVPVQFTTVHNLKTQSTARLEWGNHPVVEWPHIVSRQRSADWLRLSPDQMLVFCFYVPHINH